jgi:hypothetical protein
LQLAIGIFPQRLPDQEYQAFFTSNASFTAKWPSDAVLTQLFSLISLPWRISYNQGLFRNFDRLREGPWIT